MNLRSMGRHADKIKDGLRLMATAPPAFSPPEPTAAEQEFTEDTIAYEPPWNGERDYEPPPFRVPARSEVVFHVTEPEPRELPQRRPNPAPVAAARPVPAWPAVVTGPPPPPSPYSGVSSIWVDQIAYPEPRSAALDQRCYAPILRHVGKATGTSTWYENDAAWRLALESGGQS